MEPPTLITLGVSHFCEKARWALQRYALEFREEAHAPMFHRGACKAAGGWGSVPCLRLPQPAADSGAGSDSGPSCVDQSTPILRWVDSRCAAEAAAGGRSPPPPLFPPGAAGAEVERLCGEFDSRLGPAARRWAYSHLLYTPAISAAMAAPPVPALERRAMASGGWWLTRRLMAKGMGISPQGGTEALQEVRRCFDAVGELLADGRRYLTGDAFTAADLSFASLAAPAVGQPYGSAPGLGGDTPAAMRAEIEELRAHPAGRFALRLWAEERGVVLQAAAGS